MKSCISKNISTCMLTFRAPDLIACHFVIMVLAVKQSITGLGSNVCSTLPTLLVCVYSYHWAGQLLILCVDCTALRARK
jgi:hypothetical protein